MIGPTLALVPPIDDPYMQKEMLAHYFHAPDPSKGAIVPLRRVTPPTSANREKK